MSEVSIKPESAEEPAEDVPVFKIARDGDVAFEVFLGTAKTKIHVLVSSHRLSAASAVFNAMFNSNFKEGVGRTSADAGSGKPFVIPLPEDDATALLALCNIIHGKVDAVPKSPSIPEIHSLAVLGDKMTAVLLGYFLREYWLGILGLFWISPNSLNMGFFTTTYSVKREKSLLLIHECIENTLAELLEHGQNGEVLHYLDELRKFGLFPLAKEHKDNSILSICVSIYFLNQTLEPSLSAIDLSMMCKKLRKILDTKLGLCLDCIKTDGDSACDNKCSAHKVKKRMPPTAPADTGTPSHGSLDGADIPNSRRS
ncbi:hypothetical protein FQN51_005917 [Onygenales sp. PD_10]|nr:hypothetical protein FQN51_005917 [Onygenales sp. PD_10]